MKRKILADFQICISVPLRDNKGSNTTCDAREESDQNLGKNLLAGKTMLTDKLQLFELESYEKQQNNSRRTRQMQTWKTLF